MTDPAAKLRILVAEPRDFCPEARAILGRLGEVELRACDRDELSRAFASYDVVWFRLAHRVDAELLGQAPRCRVLATPVTGLDHVDLEACRGRGVEVVSLRGETEFLKSVRATAELTIALTLALLRRIPEAAESVRRGEWDRDRFRGHELYGKTAGIVGVGRLGTIVAGYFRAFGMRIVGFDPYAEFSPEVAERAESLDGLLRVADVVSLHVALNDSTRGLIGRHQLAAMRPEAVLVNTSRGGVVDEAALIEALDQGRIAGAALDVVSGEPHVDSVHPLVRAARGCSNLLVVPHIGGNTVESFVKTEMFLAGRVAEAVARRVAAGSRPLA